jgi:hypothetical protein
MELKRVLFFAGIFVGTMLAVSMILIERARSKNERASLEGETYMSMKIMKKPINVCRDTLAYEKIPP